MSIEEFAFSLMMGGGLAVIVGAFLWWRNDDTKIHIDPTESERWLDEVQKLDAKRKRGK